LFHQVALTPGFDTLASPRITGGSLVAAAAAAVPAARDLVAAAGIKSE
jgi:hypothetical protein